MVIVSIVEPLVYVDFGNIEVFFLWTPFVKVPLVFAKNNEKLGYVPLVQAVTS